MKLPRTKLLAEAQSMLDEIMRAISSKLLVVGWTIIPSANENNPATDPTVKLCSCSNAKFPLMNAFLDEGVSSNPILHYRHVQSK